MRYKIILLVLLSVSSFIQLYGQDTSTSSVETRQELDSLWTAFKQAKHDTTRVKTYLNIGDIYKDVKPDSAIFYYQKAVDLAGMTIDSTTTSAITTENSSEYKLFSLKATSLRYIGYVHSKQSHNNKAKEFYFKALKIAKEIGDKQEMFRCYGNIGNVHNDQGSYDKAMEYYHKSLSIAEEIGDKQGMSACYTHIGFVHYNLGNYDKAKEFYLKSLKIDEELGNKKGMSYCYNNIGNVYKFRSDYDTALVYYQKSLDIKKKIGNKRGIAYAYIGIANIFINWRKFPEALKNYKYCYKYASEIQDTIGLAAASIGMGNVYANVENLTKALIKYKDAYKYYLAVKDTEGIALSLLSLGDLYKETKELKKSKEKFLEALDLMLKKNIKIRIALIYHQLGEIDFIQKNYVEANSHFKESLKFSLETNYRKITLNNYQSLAAAYRELNQYKLAYDYLYKFYNLNDSIFNEEKYKQLEEIETKYQTAKKEKIIKQQKFKIEKEHILNDKRTEQRNFVAIGLLLLLGLLFFVLRSYRIKKKSNQLLIKQKALIQEQNSSLNQANEEITAQRDEIESQRDEIEAQRDEVVKQKEKIEQIHYEISESIDYATRLQGAILPEEKILDEYLSEHFVLFKPKDKVSGDFYWWTHIENHTVITAADCTGHGVPGAFMSMLGSSFLREIVQKEYITHTGVILRKLRKEIINSLKQKGESGEQKDGLDMAIISIDHETNIVQFSGANNPLYIVKPVIARSEATKQSTTNNEQIASLLLAMTINNKELYEIKPDKMPIAIYEKMDNFQTHEIQLEKGDQLFMFSDGYVDQFGGSKGKKFKYKPFKRMLLKNSDKPMQEQKEILNTTFENWKDNLEQVDDVVVLGVKI